MPVIPTYPGVFIDEIPNGGRLITPVATSVTAFIGSAPRGLSNKPVHVRSVAEYARKFGRLDSGSSMSYSVYQFFQNGGGDALIVRVTGVGAVAATANVGGLRLEITGAGVWGNDIRIRLDWQTNDHGAQTKPVTRFNLFVYDHTSGALEEYRDLSTDFDEPRNVAVILREESQLIHMPTNQTPSGRPSPNGEPKPGTNWFDDANTGTAFVTAQGGVDGATIAEADILGKNGPDQTAKIGINSLDLAEIFNILCIPPIDRAGDISVDTYLSALQYCLSRRAILFMDSPADWDSIENAVNGIASLASSLGTEELRSHAALFFPRIRMVDPLNENRIAEFAPCGAIAGIAAHTDANRGVWKAPAGLEARFNGVVEFTVSMTDRDEERLNSFGVNCLRNFGPKGNLVWGSRTLAGSDEPASEWKYLPVRRLSLFLEESLVRGTQWAAFEPNDESLWAQIRLTIGNCMHDLFRQGAFQGPTLNHAYFVRCDKTTTTQSDIDRGIVNIEVGFAPLKPAEFVVIRLQQRAGKTGT